MTTPERLILENQVHIMMSLSLVLRYHAEIAAATSTSRQVSKVTAVLQTAKTWPEEK